MKQISLSQGKFALVDDELFEELNRFKWYAQKAHNTYYAARNVLTIVDGRRTYKHLKMHRHIFGINDRSVIIDHIDGSGLNNQKENLRLCTPAQNRWNSRPEVGSKSVFVGVHWLSDRKKWGASIRINGKNKHLGFYEIESDAAIARNNAAIIHHGEFANLNIIPESNSSTPQPQTI